MNVGVRPMAAIGSNRRFSLRVWFLLGFLVIVALPLAALSQYLLNRYEASIQTAIVEHLEDMAAKKQNQIDGWINERLRDLQRETTDPDLGHLLQTLGQHAAKHDLQSEAYQDKARSLRHILLAHAEADYYYDTLLIDPRGNVLMSTQHESDEGTNLLHGPWRNSHLAEGFRLASRYLQRDLTSFAPYAPSGGMYAAFMYAPVMRDDRLIGVIALQIKLEQLQEIVSDRNGLGVTGETVLAMRNGEEVLYTAPLRHIEDAAFRYRVPFVKSAAPMQQALLGQVGKGLTRDYVKIEILAAWRHLPALHWGMVVKMDTSEALAGVAKLKRDTYLGLALVLILTTLAAWFFSEKIIRAMRVLGNATLRLTQGDLGVQIDRLDAPREFEQVRQHFNAMSERLEQLTNGLERQVDARTEELREAEEHTRRIIESSPNALLMVTGQGQIVLANHEAENLFGYASGELLDLKVEDLMPAALRQAHEATRKRFLLAPEPRQMGAGRDLRGVTKQGELIQIEIGLKPITLSGETFMLAAVHDVGLRKQHEAEQEAARKAAEAANQAKSDFLANMSHEIRTPMNAVIGLSQLLMDTRLDRKQADYVNKVLSSSRALLGILNDILDYSKIEAGRLELESVEFNLDALLDNMANLFSLSAEHKGIELHFDVGTDVPCLLWGDPLRLSQVLNNLAGNALKFTSQGEITVQVRHEFPETSPETSEAEQNAIILRFSVRDTGIGMTEEHMGRLFQSFSQADNSTTRKYGGTGLGLVISKQLVNMMGGDIRVSSIYGEGSCFDFDVRLHWAGGELHPTRPRDSLRGMRVLVVDDNATSLEIMQGILSSWAFQVTLADSGEAALQCLVEARNRSEPFELYLIDWKMPGMDGLELASRIQALHDSGVEARAPMVVMVTAHGHEQVAEQAGHIHLDAVLDKPMTASQLYDTIVGIQGHLPHGMPSPGPAQTQDLFELTRPIHGAKVLLVEDNATNQLVATGFLTKMGVRFDIANHGREAVDAVAQFDYAAVLMDLQMPVMDGFEATRLIRATTKGAELPILAMTAAAMTQDRQATEMAGMNAHIAKPIDPRELANALLKWLPHREPPQGSGSVLLQGALAEEGAFSVPGLDLTGAIFNMGNDWDLLRQIMLSFLHDFADAEARLNAYLEASEWNDAVRLVHTIKGLAHNVGALELEALSKTFEHELQARQKGLQADFNAQLRATLNALATLESEAEADEKAGGTGEMATAETPEYVRQQLQQLAEMLSTYSMVPHDFKDRLTRTLNASVEAKLTQRLMHAIGQLDYDTAQVVLHEVAQQLGMDLQG